MSIIKISLCEVAPGGGVTQLCRPACTIRNYSFASTDPPLSEAYNKVKLQLIDWVAKEKARSDDDLLQSIIYNTHYIVRKPRAATIELLKRLFLATDVVVSINDEYVELTGFWVEELERKVVTVPRYGLSVEEWSCLRGYYVR